jgi:hypothetical protein
MESEPVALPTVISYVRGPHDDQVAELAKRLIEDGVPCDLDLFDPRPRGGWSRWMTEKMTGTDVVLVVCSEAYYRRYHVEEKPGVGTGATFEGGMLSRRVLDAQGSEHGVIPIVFDHADLRWIPEFLKDETRFVLPEQFDELYRVLTNQPAFVKPALGKIRLMPPLVAGKPRPEPAAAAPLPETPRGKPVAPATLPTPTLPIAVFHFEDGSLIFGRYAELVRENGTTSMHLVVEDDRDAANYPRIREHRGTLAMGWDLNAAYVRVQSYREVHRDGKRMVDLVLAEERRGSSFGSEVNVNGITPDQIALRRARRILLDERPVVSELGTFSSARMNEETLEYYVSGQAGGEIGVTRSPIPGIVASGNEDPVTLEVIRLVCAFLLIITNTVERITKLDVRRVEEGIAVDFAGVRDRQYVNVDPVTLTVVGVCPVPQS